MRPRVLSMTVVLALLASGCAGLSDLLPAEEPTIGSLRYAIDAETGEVYDPLVGPRGGAPSGVRTPAVAVERSDLLAPLTVGMRAETTVEQELRTSSADGRVAVFLSRTYAREVVAADAAGVTVQAEVVAAEVVDRTPGGLEGFVDDAADYVGRRGTVQRDARGVVVAMLNEEGGAALESLGPLLFAQVGVPVQADVGRTWTMPTLMSRDLLGVPPVALDLTVADDVGDRLEVELNRDAVVDPSSNDFNLPGRAVARGLARLDRANPMIVDLQFEQVTTLDGAGSTPITQSQSVTVSSRPLPGDEVQEAAPELD